MVEKDKTQKRVERHKITQEDFTPEVVVEDMLGRLPENIFTDFENKVLDNSCGTGNILLAVLKRRLSNCSTINDAISAMRGLYGVELMADNVEECRTRLYNEVIQKFPSVKSDIQLNYELRNVIKNRIQWGDSLTFDYNHWPKLRTFGKRDQTINFRELQKKEDTKYPMWYKDTKIIEPTLFDDYMFG